MAGRIFLCVCLSQLYYYTRANTALTILGTDQNEGNKRGFVFNIDVASAVVKKMNLFKILRPVAIVYDDVKEKMYWSDIKSKQIRSARLDGTEETSVLDLPTDSVIEGITIDTNEQLLFYTDKGLKTIVRVSLNNTATNDSEVVLASTDVEKPRGITVYTHRKLLIWTDWKAWACIEVSDYDGKNRKTLIDSDISWPNDVTLDDKTETLYWCDANPRKHTIESVKLDGTERRLIYKDESSHFYGIKFFEDILYLTDWDAKSVHLYYTNGTKKNEVTFGDFVRPSGLFLMRRSTCKDGEYGSRCEACGHCADSRPCNKVYGTCNACSLGYYGSSCNEKCHCKNDTPGCDKWRSETCQTTKTTTSKTTSTTTLPSTTLLTTTIMSSTLLSTEKTVLSLEKSLTTQGYVDNIPKSVMIDYRRLQRSSSISIGVLAFLFCGFFITTLVAVLFVHRHRRTITQLSESHASYQRSVSVSTTVTKCSPTYSREDSEEETCPDVIMTSSMLDKDGHPNTDFDNMSEDGLADTRYGVLVKT